MAFLKSGFGVLDEGKAFLQHPKLTFFPRPGAGRGCGPLQVWILRKPYHHTGGRQTAGRVSNVRGMSAL
jgi:hypothetical protein